MLHLVWQAAADFEPSADISKDYDDDDETDQLEAQDMKHDDSEDDVSNDGKRLPLNRLRAQDFYRVILYVALF